MTEEEILEGNLLLADFMGVKLGVDKYSWRIGCIEPLRAEHLNYHGAWGHVMPVWMKFRDLNIDNKEYSDWLSSLSWYMYSANEPRQFFERLVYAIKWYNEQKK